MTIWSAIGDFICAATLTLVAGAVIIPLTLVVFNLVEWGVASVTEVYPHLLPQDNGATYAGTVFGIVIVAGLFVRYILISGPPAS